MVINVTDECFHRILYVSNIDNRENAILRVAVEGGGCSGFQYRFLLEDKENISKDDNVILNDGKNVMVVIDPSSMKFLEGSTISFKDEIMETCFFVDNPSAKSGCGCGQSFSFDITKLM